MREKTTAERIQLNMTQAFVDRVATHMRRTGQANRTQAIHDIVLGVGRFAPDVEDWLAERLGENQDLERRHRLIERSLREAMRLSPSSAQRVARAVMMVKARVRARRNGASRGR